MSVDPEVELRDAPPGYRGDIDGLRAVAIVLVVLYHAKRVLAPGGYVGVDVFFVISGFLITGQILGDLYAPDRRFSFALFYARRMRRLLPALVLVAIATTVVSAVYLPPLRAHVVAGDTTAAGVYGINYRLALRDTNYLTASAPPSPLQHYWSLAVEEQFYAVWPLLLVVTSTRRLGGARRRRLPRAPRVSRRTVAFVLAAVGLVSFALCQVMTSRSAVWAYYLLPARAWELAVGGLLSLVPRGTGARARRLALAAGWAGLASIVVAARTFSDATPFPGSAALLPVAGAALVVAAGPAASRRAVGTLLGIRPGRALGKLSYSLYLWHYPALILAPAIVAPSPSVKTALAFAVVASSAACYLLVERPVHRMTWLVARPRRGIALGVLLSLVCVLAGVMVSARLPKRLGFGPAAPVIDLRGTRSAADVEAAVAAATSARVVPSNLTPSLLKAADDLPVSERNGCHVGHHEMRVRACTYGDFASHTDLVLFGDSHAAQWLPALDAIGRQERWRVVSVTKSGCPAVRTTVHNELLRRTYTECDVWRRSAEAFVRRLHPALVLFGTSEQYGDPSSPSSAAFDARWVKGTRDVLAGLRASATELVWLADTPLPRDNVPDCVATHLADWRPCDQPATTTSAHPQRRATELAAAVDAGARVVDPVPWLCTSDTCPVVVGNLLVYRDSSHITTACARWLAPLLRRELTSSPSTDG